MATRVVYITEDVKAVVEIDDYDYIHADENEELPVTIKALWVHKRDLDYF